MKMLFALSMAFVCSIASAQGKYRMGEYPVDKTLPTTPSRSISRQRISELALGPETSNVPIFMRTQS
jgi:hypothetical protein